MFRKQPADEPRCWDHGCLNSRHTFSCNDYYDPNYMVFRVLWVINNDRLRPGRGVGTHDPGTWGLLGPDWLIVVRS
jgi:redox-sensitive bicupin YhaK (pirin superfamily)